MARGLRAGGVGVRRGWVYGGLLCAGVALGFAGGIGITDAHLKIDRQLIDQCSALTTATRRHLDLHDEAGPRVVWSEAEALDD